MQKLLQSTMVYRILRQERALGTLAHAYLILLDDETYLRFALKEFAKLFFDGSADTSARIDRGNYVDCAVFPEEGTTWNVENAEKIVEASYLSPTESGCKVFILTDMQKASPVVQNKLLKVLEEPPAGVHFLLGATVEHPLLSTVRSRAKRLEIPPFSVESVGACLGRLYPERSKEELIGYAAASGGSVGRARRLLEDGRYAELLDKAFACVEAHGGQIVTVTRGLQNVTEKKELVGLVASLYRDMLFYRLGKGEYATLRDRAGRLSALAEEFSPAVLVFALDRMNEAEKEISFNANLSQCMEVSLLKIDKEKSRC